MTTDDRIFCARPLLSRVTAAQFGLKTRQHRELIRVERVGSRAIKPNNNRPSKANLLFQLSALSVFFS